MASENQTSIPDKIVSAANSIQGKPPEEIREQLIYLLNELINTDFHALVQLLYRIDVDEKKLKQVLVDHTGTDAASIIADLVISRQLQKIASKEAFSRRVDTADDDS